MAFTRSTFGTSTRGGSNSGPWECHLVVVVWSVYLPTIRRVLSGIHKVHFVVVVWFVYLQTIRRVLSGIPKFHLWDQVPKSGPWECHLVVAESTTWHSQCPLLEPPGSKSGHWQCHFVLSVSSVDANTIPRLLRVIPNVHFWNLTAGRFQKCTLGMPLNTLCIVCKYKPYNDY